MSDAAQGTGGAADAGAAGGGQLGVLLVCFDKLKAAAQARHFLDHKLRSGGDALLDTVILQVNAKHKVSVYDPRRVVQGTLTAALTWGLFGLVSGGLKSLAIWAILGAVCGGLWAYYTEHLLKKHELARIGTGLPASSSALATFAGTSDPRRLLAATAPYSPAAASVAAGALAGAFGGGGVHSIVTNAVVTGIGWAVFGLVAGALYGLWAGRAVSARRLKSLGPFIAPGTSMIVAWAGGPVRQDTIGPYTTPGSQRLILRFNPVEGGAVLEAA